MTSTTIAQAAYRIAGDIFGDAQGTLEQRLTAAINWKNQGTDSDLAPQDREALRSLLERIAAENDAAQEPA